MVIPIPHESCICAKAELVGNGKFPLNIALAAMAANAAAAGHDVIGLRYRTRILQAIMRTSTMRATWMPRAVVKPLLELSYRTWRIFWCKRETVTRPLGNCILEPSRCCSFPSCPAPRATPHPGLSALTIELVLLENTVAVDVALGQSERRLGSHPSGRVHHSGPVRRTKSLAEVLTARTPRIPIPALSIASSTACHSTS